jgi:hypothetical protein
MSTSQAFFGHRGPTTSVSAAKVSPQPLAMLIGVSLAEIAGIAGIEVRRFPDLACPDFTSENPARYPRAPEGAPKWT